MVKKQGGFRVPHEFGHFPGEFAVGNAHTFNRQRHDKTPQDSMVTGARSNTRSRVCSASFPIITKSSRSIGRGGPAGMRFWLSGTREVVVRIGRGSSAIDGSPDL